MSYNIDSFKIRKIENFKIPMIEFTDKKYFCNPEIVDLSTNKILISSNMAEVCDFEGYFKDDLFEITKINIYGEGSGHFMATKGDNILKNSTGTLIARLVWESGDSVENISYINGIFKREEL